MKCEPLYVSESRRVLGNERVIGRTLCDDLSFQCLDFILASHFINFSPEASEGNSYTRDKAIRTLAKCNGVLLRPASD
jgi:hypothetical protein